MMNRLYQKLWVRLLELENSGIENSRTQELENSRMERALK
jgi:hypothetical protein